MEFFQNYSLKEYNTFGIDVKAESFFSYEDEHELIDFSLKNITKNTNYFILGGGSNVLFRGFFTGLIIHSKITNIDTLNENKESVTLRVGSGLEWDKFVEYCVKKKYYGIENLSLIPGNVGAAPVQNIGAYGTEVEEVIVDVSAYDLSEKRKVYLSKEECCFSYRNSIFKKEAHKNLVITSVDFRLFKTTPYKRKINSYQGSTVFRQLFHAKTIFMDVFTALKTLKFNSKKKSISIDYRVLKNLFENLSFISIKRVRVTIINKRNSKIPNPKEIGNVGSFFKNPIISIKKSNQIKNQYNDSVIYPLDSTSVKISAGWLIKQSGWADKPEEKVGLYKDQTLIIVNKSNASGNEIFDYSERIVESVYNKFKIKLEREVVII